MPRLTTCIVTLLGTIMGMVGIPAASPADERRERAEALQAEAASLAKQGFNQEAEALRNEASELLAVAERSPNGDRRSRKRFDERAELIERLKLEVEELLELGRRDEAVEVRARIKKLKLHRSRRDGRSAVDGEIRERYEYLERLQAEHEKLERTGNIKERREVEKEIKATKLEIVELKERRNNTRRGSHNRQHHDEIAQRIEHLHVAAEILGDDGQHDLAHAVRERADAMEREQRQRREPNKAMNDDQRAEIRELHAIIRDLRDDFQQLQDQVNELRKHNEKSRD